MLFLALRPGGTPLSGRIGENGAALVTSGADDGTGIDSANLPYIFDRFYQADQFRSRGLGGAGPGPAISRAIIEGHRGTIAVASDVVEPGATATIHLPMNE